MIEKILKTSNVTFVVGDITNGRMFNQNETFFPYVTPFKLQEISDNQPLKEDPIYDAPMLASVRYQNGLRVRAELNRLMIEDLQEIKGKSIDIDQKGLTLLNTFDDSFSNSITSLGINTIYFIKSKKNRSLDFLKNKINFDGFNDSSKYEFIYCLEKTEHNAVNVKIYGDHKQKGFFIDVNIHHDKLSFKDIKHLLCQASEYRMLTSESVDKFLENFNG